ncbi:MAG: protoporphyrinogen oxidase [Rhabdochlamydiaceae bacterium]|nr:protoporphyrinogen oxidase [Rhabdochlamydiaceae bacterium]
MGQQRIFVLGAGISGLCYSWYLKKCRPNTHVTLLEKTERIGGWIDTTISEGFLFEKGPRAFKAAKSASILELVKELNLENELVWKEEKKLDRYLWLEDKLHCLPQGLFSFLFSPITRPVVKALLTEWSRPAFQGDETVWEFACRRFNKEVASRFFDPLVVGIFGGDARQISIASCFPKLKEWEAQQGSVTKGMWRALKCKRHQPKFSEHVPHLPLSAFYSFRSGMQTLVDALVRQLDAEITTNAEALHIERRGAEWIVHSTQGPRVADDLCLALPAAQSARLLKPFVPDLAQELEQIISLGFAIINVGYRDSVLPLQGFGYLTQSLANEEVLGSVFDSSVFPEQSQTAHETRLTIKLRDSAQKEEEAIQSALRGARRHLSITSAPDAIAFKRASYAIPQYGVGHLEKMVRLQQAIKERLPTCSLVGNYLSGVAVDQCIAHAKHVAQGH